MLHGVEDDDILDRYIFAGEQAMVRSVFVGGHQCVRNGKHEARDTAAAGFKAIMKEFSE
jgi:hypothetical protein